MDKQENHKVAGAPNKLGELISSVAILSYHTFNYSVLPDNLPSQQLNCAKHNLPLTLHGHTLLG